jgi:hypothetical protein
MGVHSTMNITEKDARLLLMKMVFKASNKEIEAMMDAAFDDKFYNFRIVNDYDPNDDSNYQEGSLDY